MHLGKKLKVGLFGYYSYGNLGNNLIAFLLSRHIRGPGFAPAVFTKSPDFIRSLDLKSRLIGLPT